MKGFTNHVASSILELFSNIFYLLSVIREIVILCEEKNWIYVVMTQPFLYKMSSPWFNSIQGYLYSSNLNLLQVLDRPSAYGGISLSQEETLASLLFGLGDFFTKLNIVFLNINRSFHKCNAGSRSRFDDLPVTWI